MTVDTDTAVDGPLFDGWLTGLGFLAGDIEGRLADGLAVVDMVDVGRACTGGVLLDAGLADSLFEDGAGEALDGTLDIRLEAGGAILVRFDVVDVAGRLIGDYPS